MLEYLFSRKDVQRGCSALNSNIFGASIAKLFKSSDMPFKVFILLSWLASDSFSMISVSKNLTNVDKKRQHILGQVTVQYKESKDPVLCLLPNLKKLVIKMTTKDNWRSGFYFILFIWGPDIKISLQLS